MSTQPSTNPHLVPSFKHWRRWLVALLGFITAFLIFCWWEARLPDESLSFVREASSQLPIKELSSKLETVTKWKDWFHNVREAQVVDSQNHPLPRVEQMAHTGALLEIQIDPGKGSHRVFRLAGKITRFEPGKVLEIQILDDSSGKITKLFDQLSWKIELIPSADGKSVQIVGTETAHTSHWRSRLFGRLAPRVLLNQLFYPNLLVLSNPVTPPKADGMF
ncbi:MAG: hypothetical protein ACJ763_10635 [Bdellovibrionia bacterium]